MSHWKSTEYRSMGPDDELFGYTMAEISGLIAKDKHEEYMIAKYPMVKDAWEQYQIALRLASENK